MTSIIIATIKGREEFLEEALASAEAQTVPCEIIVLDGLEGAGKTLNKGIKQAKGDFIFNLDDDDMIAPNCVERLEAEIGDYDVIFPDLMLWYTDKMVPYKQGFYGCELLESHNTMPGIWLTTKAAALKAPFENVKVGWDHLRNKKFCSEGMRIKHLPELLYYYRQWSGQTMKNEAK